MNYYRIEYEGKSELLICPKPMDYMNILETFNGQSLLDRWVPVRVRRVAPKPGMRVRPVDFPYFLPGVLAARTEKLGGLVDVLAQDCELLPLNTGADWPHVALNIRQCLPHALDHERSDIVYFPESNKIMAIRRYVLRHSVLDSVPIARCELRSGDVFVSEEFRKVYSEQKMTGLTFQDVELV